MSDTLADAERSRRRRSFCDAEWAKAELRSLEIRKEAVVDADTYREGQEVRLWCLHRKAFAMRTADRRWMRC